MARTHLPWVGLVPVSHKARANARLGSSWPVIQPDNGQLYRY